MEKVYIVTLYTQNEYGFMSHEYVKLAFDANKYTRPVLKSLARKLAEDTNKKMHYPHVYTNSCKIELLKIH